MTTKLIIRPNLKRLRQRFKAAIKVAKEDQSAYAQASIYLSRWVTKNFQSQGGELTGAKWKPLKAGGRLKKRGKKRFATGRTVNRWQLDRSAKILQDTGRLRASFYPFVRGSGKTKYSGIRSDLPYAAVHEFGLRKVPQRRMLPKPSEVRDPIRLIFDRFVENVADELRR